MNKTLISAEEFDKLFESGADMEPYLETEVILRNPKWITSIQGIRMVLNQLYKNEISVESAIEEIDDLVAVFEGTVNTYDTWEAFP